MRKVFLLLLGLGACVTPGPDEPLAVTFDPFAPLQIVSSNPDQDGAVAAGLAMWNGMAGTMLTLAEVDGAPQVTITFQDAAAPFHGYYSGDTGEVFINTDLSGHALSVTVAHELGHAFGFLHIRDRDSVMNPNNLNIEPNQEDADALGEMWLAAHGSPRFPGELVTPANPPTRADTSP